MIDENIRNALRLVQSMGRGNDTILAHINPREAKLLKKRGGSGKINPKTGLLEFDDSDHSEGGEGGGGDNVRADSVSQSEQSSADQAARQDASAGNENAASVRMGDTVGGLSADTGASAGPAVGQSQGDVNAAIAAAQNAQQGLASMSNAFGSQNAPPSLIGGNSNLPAVANEQAALQNQLNALVQQSATDVASNPSAGLPNLADVGATNYSFNTTGLNANGQLNPTMEGGLSAQLAQAAGAGNVTNNPLSYNTAAQALQGQALAQMQAQQNAEFNAPIPNAASDNNPIRLGETPNTGVVSAAPAQSLASILGQNLAPTTIAYTPPAATVAPTSAGAGTNDLVKALSIAGTTQAPAAAAPAVATTSPITSNVPLPPVNPAQTNVAATTLGTVPLSPANPAQPDVAAPTLGNVPLPPVNPSPAAPAAPQQGILDKLFGPSETQVNNILNQPNTVAIDENGNPTNLPNSTSGLTKEEWAAANGVDPSQVVSRIVDYGNGPQVNFTEDTTRVFLNGIRNAPNTPNPTGMSPRDLTGSYHASSEYPNTDYSNNRPSYANNLSLANSVLGNKGLFSFLNRNNQNKPAPASTPYVYPVQQPYMNYATPTTNYDTGINWGMVPGYTGYAKGGNVGENNALANSIRMLKMRNKP